MSRTRTHASTASCARGERARGDAAEERRAVGRALLDRRALDRDPEHRGDDLQPELAAGPAAGRAADPGLDPELAQELERVPQPVGDALEDGTDQCAAVMSEGQSLEHGPRVRVRMRRALALEVRQERQPLGARRPARRLGDELVVRLADHVAQPPQRAGRGEHHAHRLPRVRDGVAEDVDARLRIGAEAVERGEDDARRAEHDRDRPGPDDADAERARLLVAGAADRRRLVCGRQPLHRDLERRRRPPPTSAARRRRRAASPTPRRRRSPARRSAAAGRSPSAGARAPPAPTPRARACAPRGASAP